MAPTDRQSTAPNSPPPGPSAATTKDSTPDEPATSADMQKTTKRARTTEGKRAARTEQEPTREHESVLTENDSVMNPRDVRALPKRPPAAVSKDEYPWPDPLLPPTDTEDDPHAKRTRDRPLPTPHPRSRVAYTDAVYDRICIPLDKLVEKLRIEQREGLLAAPEDFLAVVPYGAGSVFFRNNPYIQKTLMAFLKTFRCGDDTGTESDSQMLQAIIDEGTPEQIEAALLAQDERNPELKNLQVIMPVPSSKTTNLKDKFSLPWAIWLAGCPPWLRRLLLYQGTFSVSKELTFSVTELDASIFSWVLGNYKGDAIKRDNADAILAMIKRALWRNDMFRAHVNRVFTKRGVRGDINEHAVLATNSFTLSFFDNTDSLGYPATVAQLRGRPVGDNNAERREYGQIVRSTQFWIGLNPLILAGVISCQMCKAETHPTYECSFCKTEGWFGSTYDGAERHAARVQKALLKAKKPDERKGKDAQRKGPPSQKKGRK